ncbi:nuclear valosin-containing protein-like isoform X7 [Syngnathoides biaculeatus]|uniref:nuclear valosin-containing protein-like isoform X7 n=1 Tax=Syngnathoides biaculeatus TaxID=300417 RepID=UPI002ADDACDB|nr:nuclear valosin-containing protein-like isoform X7 [Syngnathoides biaculeatus]
MFDDSLDIINEMDMKNRGVGCVDARLRQRLEQYLASSCSEVDVCTIALELQKQYRVEYGRRNKTAFRIQVEKVYQAIKMEYGLNDVENGHLTKRAKHIHSDPGVDSCNSSEDILEKTNTSHMNSSLTSLYRKGNCDSISSSTFREMPDTSAVSRRGWFIDRGPAKTSTFIDLSKDKPLDSVNKEVSVLEGGKKSVKRKNRTHENTLTTSKTGILLAKSRSTKLQYSTLKFEDVGGNEGTLTEVCKLLIHMKHPEIYQQLGMVPPRGFLLHGPPGCGKTLLAQAVAGELDLPMLKVSAPELVSGVSGESEQKLRELFDLAATSAPCIIFIDEIDAITQKREMASKDMERRIVAQLLTCMDDLNRLTVTTQVLVIGATNRPDSLDPALRRAGRFDKEICLGIPDEPSRHRILKTLCRKLRIPEDFDYSKLAHLTPGYVGADLMALCREAAMNAVNRVLLVEKGPPERSKTNILNNDLLKLSLENEAMTNKDMSVNIGTVSSLSLHNTKLGIVEVNQLSQDNPGHEHLPAVANESGLNFISVKGPELLNMYVGESERAVRQIFQRGRNSAPCVIFFDEIDALCPRRSGHESGASVRVVNQLLTEMDGLETRRQVFIMAATNRPDIIDPAVLRPGRLDKTLYVGMPPPADRHAILLTITKSGTKPQLEEDVNLEEIAYDERCGRFTGADLTALMREASVNALKAYMKSKCIQPTSSGHTFSSGPVADIRVSKKNLEDAFKKVRPSVSKKKMAVALWPHSGRRDP